MNIIRVNFPDNQYVKKMSKKTQIIIHHTVSGPGINGDVNWWKTTSDRVATHFIIDRNGLIHQLFDTQYWAYALALKGDDFKRFGIPYKNLDESAIQIELDSWGPLNANLQPIGNPKFGKVKYFYEYCPTAPFRSYRFYEMYYDKQLAALKELLLDLTKQYNIPRKYNTNFFEQNRDALSGVPGIWGHVSYKSEKSGKSDPHPQIELINMLKSLENA